MENKKETLRILNLFYTDCFKFWLVEGKNIKTALVSALNETMEVTHNPFDPQGKLLNTDAKNEFINRIINDLKEMDI